MNKKFFPKHSSPEQFLSVLLREMRDKHEIVNFRHNEIYHLTAKTHRWLGIPFPKHKQRDAESIEDAENVNHAEFDYDVWTKTRHLDVEVDGNQHLEPAQIDKDDIRDHLVYEQYGIDHLRFRQWISREKISRKNFPYLHERILEAFA